MLVFVSSSNWFFFLHWIIDSVKTKLWNHVSVLFVNMYNYVIFFLTTLIHVVCSFAHGWPSILVSRSIEIVYLFSFFPRLLGFHNFPVLNGQKVIKRYYRNHFLWCALLVLYKFIRCHSKCVKKLCRIEQKGLENVAQNMDSINKMIRLLFESQRWKSKKYSTVRAKATAMNKWAQHMNHRFLYLLLKLYYYWDDK